MRYFTYLKKEIIRTGDLAPKGIRSTIDGDKDYNKTWEHIYNQIRKK